jgi:hypothetical protein
MHAEWIYTRWQVEQRGMKRFIHTVNDAARQRWAKCASVAYTEHANTGQNNRFRLVS